MRELKLDQDLILNKHLRRTFTGAWIETTEYFGEELLNLVAPSRVRELKHYMQ